MFNISVIVALISLSSCIYKERIEKKVTWENISNEHRHNGMLNQIIKDTWQNNQDKPRIWGTKKANSSV